MRGERLFVAALIVFSVAAAWVSYGIAGFTKWSSPGVFPMLASATMFLCAIVIFRNTHSSASDSSADNESSKSQTGDCVSASEPSAPDMQKVLPTRVLVITGLLIAYVAAMPTLGFLLSSGIFLLLGIGYLWRKPLWITLLVSLGSLVIIHFIFRKVFQVVLPEGTLIRLLVQ